MKESRVEFYSTKGLLGLLNRRFQQVMIPDTEDPPEFLNADIMKGQNLLDIEIADYHLASLTRSVRYLFINRSID